MDSTGVLKSDSLPPGARAGCPRHRGQDVSATKRQLALPSLSGANRTRGGQTLQLRANGPPKKPIADAAIGERRGRARPTLDDGRCGHGGRTSPIPPSPHPP